ncbi:MAG: hypothetical protein A2920_03230 [Candidatus Zambryskibacteria bacterium RIFCSPLOWO2_01_FULL_43_17]|uniref:Ribosome-binding factor A n=1 Tax=Candidatus Zambryskibacteria bacterium RIFCSPLOWO2_01_FULL_43_17 TaxID=1802760 RepID=A0A1G2U481_9BACT|nr:MAG: hypothetical protein A2920_03230 [Candidatus Zambryskibacteria bacterium RIFCSPLOWO2_01_FULL_43_17]
MINARPNSHRKEKLPKLLEHLAAEFVQGESNQTSLITITGSDITPNQRRVTIYFTTLPEGQEVAVGEFLKRRTHDFLQFVDSRAKIGRMPEIAFVFDKGEKNRQRIDFLLQNE